MNLSQLLILLFFSIWHYKYSHPFIVCKIIFLAIILQSLPLSNTIENIFFASRSFPCPVSLIPSSHLWCVHSPPDKALVAAHTPCQRHAGPVHPHSYDLGPSSVKTGCVCLWGRPPQGPGASPAEVAEEGGHAGHSISTCQTDRRRQ